MGPRLKDVEDADEPLAVDGEQLRFNGATSQGRGRLATALLLCDGVIRASMGPRLKDVEDASASGNWSAIPFRLQWGHVSRTWKTGLDRRWHIYRDGLQWGHVSRTWKTPWG